MADLRIARTAQIARRAGSPQNTIVAVATVVRDVLCVTRAPLYLAILVLGGCAQQPPDPWVRQDSGALPTAGDVSDCHIEARRLAGFQYPDQKPQGPSGPTIEDDHRFPAEIGFYNQCMTRKGFVRRS
jgi:hypothetical protein